MKRNSIFDAAVDTLVIKQLSFVGIPHNINSQIPYLSDHELGTYVVEIDLKSYKEERKI